MGKSNNVKKQRRDYNGGYNNNQRQNTSHYTKNREYNDRFSQNQNPLNKYSSQQDQREFVKPESYITKFIESLENLAGTFNANGANIEVAVNRKKEANGIIMVDMQIVRTDGENEKVERLFFYFAENQYLGKNARPVKAYPTYSMIVSAHTGAILFNTFGTSNVCDKTIHYATNILSKNTGIEINENNEPNNASDANNAEEVATESIPEVKADDGKEETVEVHQAASEGDGPVTNEVTE